MGETSAQDMLRIERSEGWAELVLNRPARRNSFIAPLADEVTAALQMLATDDSVSCVILRGAEGYFCAGIDLRALQADPPPQWRSRQGAAMRAMHLAFYHFGKPVIGALEGFAINAGAALALACDQLVVGENAFFQIGEIQQGAPIPMNVAWLRIKASEVVAARLALSGDRVDGRTLVALGLAGDVVPDPDVLARVREMAQKLAAMPAGAPATIKAELIAQRQIADPEAFFRQSNTSALLNAPMVKR